MPKDIGFYYMNQIVFFYFLLNKQMCLFSVFAVIKLYPHVTSLPYNRDQQIIEINVWSFLSRAAIASRSK